MGSAEASILFRPNGRPQADCRPAVTARPAAGSLILFSRTGFRTRSVRLSKQVIVMNKTLHVTHILLSLEVGGLERNVINQARLAAEVGQVVSLVCLERPGVLAPQAECHGARVVCLHKRPGIRLGVFRQLKQALRDLAPDVVHTHQIGTLFYAGPAARAARVPFVVHTEHGRQDYARRLRRRLLGRIGGRFADLFFCLTEDMASEVRSQRIVPDRKIRVILNGIDTARYAERCDAAAVRQSLGIPAEAPVVGTVGRLNEVKRQDLLIRAFSKIRARKSAAHLIIVGDGPLMQPLRNLATGLGLGECVHLVGYQAHTTPYLRAMDVFALTSRSEGMPQAVLEASIAGLPVVASRVGGLPEVVDDGVSGVLFDPGAENALVDALLRILDDPDLGRRMGDAARLRVESRFDVKRMASDYHRHFLELFSRRRPCAVG
jgi:sugar transferase (PEP-CTERM/EpsH1 system associated)